MRRKKPAGALWGRAARRTHGGRCWAEVYCGSAESGSWVHADPVSGAVDRCVHSVLLTIKGCNLLLASEHLVVMHTAMRERLPIPNWQSVLLKEAVLR